MRCTAFRERANVALPVHLARPGSEERRAATEQHRCEVDAQLVDEALFERLADDVAAAHDHDVTMGHAGPRLVDRGDQIVDDEVHPQFAFQPDVARGAEWVTTKNGGVPV